MNVSLAFNSSNISPATLSPPTHQPLQSFVWTPVDIVLATLVALILASIILATIVGNALVITAIFSERNLRIVANYLIASLAVADLLVASLVMPILAIKEVSHRWVLGAAMCEAWISMDVLCCTASILHLLAIAVDRYWAVTRASYIHDRPVRPIVLMIILSWVVSTLLCIPSSFVWWSDLEDEEADDNMQRFNQQQANVQNHSLDQAAENLREPAVQPRTGSSLKSFNNPDDTGVCKISQDWGYTVYSTMAAFFIPLIAIVIIYAKVYRVARRRIRKKQFSGNKTSFISDDGQKVGESTDEGCLEGSLTSNQFLNQQQSPEFSRSKSDLQSANIKKRRVGIWACLCCKARAQEKNGLNKQYSKELKSGLSTDMKLLTNDLNEVSCLSLTPTNQSTQMFLPSFATSATAMTTLTSASADQKSTDVADVSCESLGQLLPSQRGVATTRNEVGKESATTELGEAAPPNEMADGSSSPQMNPSNFPLPSPPANTGEDSADENDFLKTKENDEEGRKNKRPIKRQSLNDVCLSSPACPTRRETPKDFVPTGDSYKLANFDDAMTHDKQFTCPPKRSITFQTIESGLHSSTEDFQEHNEEREDQAFYDETADDGDDETDTNDKADDFTNNNSSNKRLHSTEFLKTSDPLIQSALPRSRHNSIQFSSQPPLLKDDQRPGKLSSSCRHKQRQQHSGLHLHLRPRPHSRKQRPTRQAKERRAREKREQARERKAARTLAIITGSFVVCWLPFFITALVMPFCGTSCYMPPIVESIIAWLGYLNSGLNPVIYTIFNVDFRVAFKKIVFGKKWKG